MIPEPRKTDADDVTWALSTAAALWQSGASADAVRWLRRAAERANDRDDELRAVELFKAAATLASSLPPPSGEQPCSEPINAFSRVPPPSRAPALEIECELELVAEENVEESPSVLRRS